MPFAESLWDQVQLFGPTLTVVAGYTAVAWVVHRLLTRRNLVLQKERRLPWQLILIVLTMFGAVAVILTLPVPPTTRNQLLTVFGLLASGSIALASTTLVANGMAGIMLRATRGFRTGDFIRVEKFFGRVVECGLLDTELQNEDRELTMLPNLYLVTHPVTVVRSSGTLVSVDLSLGYDVHHAAAEPLLVEAARQTGLEEPFVRVIELGNYAVSYRVSGFLADVGQLLSARSGLCRAVLDELHGAGIEIASPTIMAQRQVPPDARLVPVPAVSADVPEGQPVPEDLMFDKAKQAEQLELHRRQLESAIGKLEERIASAEKGDRDRLRQELESRQKELAGLAEAKDGS